MADKPTEIAPLWAISAEFGSPEDLLAAVHALKPHAFGRLDAFTPVPAGGIDDAIGLRTDWIRPIAVGGVVLGFMSFMAMCAYATGFDYVFMIGGRPAVSWMSYVVPAFSFSLMFAALLVTLAMIVLNRLPRLNHPAFNIPGFLRASQDRFFLAIERRHDNFDPPAIERVLASLAVPPLAVRRVPR